MCKVHQCLFLFCFVFDRVENFAKAMITGVMLAIAVEAENAALTTMNFGVSTVVVILQHKILTCAFLD